ncbi:hypothetical protein BE20_24075 [Sorangium cellulosum]|uniref:Transposase n=1 Tax=Sorangium cellulosum TaxID=56 RepID=A0A150S6S8_SORCE|nr:hypothetical protein BE20_24075 [Sorangium cellulosum]KYG00815.1 hypothetical protein BE18_12330 [Sorangium cellulosum]
MAKPGKRRKFSAAEKLRIVREAAACTQRGEIDALLRREGIDSSLLAAWRKLLALHGSEALAERKLGHNPHDVPAARRLRRERGAARAAWADQSSRESVAQGTIAREWAKI